MNAAARVAPAASNRGRRTCRQRGEVGPWASAVSVTILVGYVAVLVAANVATAHLPPVTVPGVVEVPVGALLAGAALAVRDAVHETGGRVFVAAAIALGGLVSAVLASPELALASTVAFVASELVDAVVYHCLRHRSRLTALIVSNLAGLIVDTAVFVPLAFGTYAAVPGQLIAKIASTLAIAAAAAAIGRVASTRRLLGPPRPRRGRGR